MGFTKKELKELSRFNAITPIAMRLGTTRLWVRKVLHGRTHMTTKLQLAIKKEARDYLDWLQERKNIS